MYKYTSIVLLAASSLLSGCQYDLDFKGGKVAEPPKPGDYSIFQPGEITPYPQAVVQIEKPDNATTLDINFSYRSEVYIRRVSNLNNGANFISSVPAEFFNAVDLEMIVGESFTVNARFLNDSQQQVGAIIRLVGVVPAVKAPNAILFIVSNY